MILNKHEKKMLQFLADHPNEWHTYAKDKTTLRTLGSLYFLRGLGVRGLEVDRQYNHMRLNTWGADNPGLQMIKEAIK